MQVLWEEEGTSCPYSHLSLLDETAVSSREREVM
jgi:hypothetical protein